MSPHPPLQTLLFEIACGPDRNRASRALLTWVDQALLRARVRPHLRDRVHGRVSGKLVELALAGRHQGLDDAGAYALTMVRHAAIDAAHEDQRHLGTSSFDGEQGGPWFEPSSGPSEAEEKAALEEELALCRERARALLGRAFEALLAVTAQRYHAGLRLTFEQLCAVSFDAASLRALLSRDGAAPSPAALAAAYKRHERMRAGLRGAIVRLLHESVLPARKAAQAQRCLTLLLRPGTGRYWASR